MKTAIFILLITNCSLLIALRQVSYGQSQFQRTFGGNLSEGATSIIQTPDGGYAVSGNTLSFGVDSSDIYIVKLNSGGNLQWSKTIGGAGNDIANSIAITSDGGYAVAGYTTSYGTGYTNMFIVKLDDTGMLQWSRTVGGTSHDYANRIVQTAGGYAVAGQTYLGASYTDMFIVALDASGTLQWSRRYAYSDNAYSIVQTTDGGYVMAGSEALPPDMYILKIGSSGGVTWMKKIGGTGDDMARSIVRTTDGGYTVAGYTNSFGAGSSDFYVVKVNGSGNLQWSKTIGGIGSEIAYSIVQTTDGGYAVAGQTNSFGAG